MATIEDAVVNFSEILRDDLPAILTAIENEKKDGIKLEPIRVFEFEETREAIIQTPAALIIGTDEVDATLKDMLRDANIQLYLVVTDRNKKHLTKKLWRYGQAIRRVLRPVASRTLKGKVISAKVMRVAYSPTFVDRDNLFCRDLQADIVLRVAKEND